MNRHSDILELLEVVRLDIVEISLAYESARRDEDVENVLRPKIKSCLENLRSCLEYSAQDIWRSYTKKKNSIYFPYGRTEELFQKSVKKNLPGLEEHAPEVYALVVSLQPFVDESNWLSELCLHTNFNKHNGLSAQVRKNSSKSITKFGNFITMEGNVSVTINGGSYNGVPISRSGVLKISTDERVSKISKDINVPVPLTREFEWVKFEIDGTISDVLELVEDSHSRISIYISNLSGII